MTEVVVKYSATMFSLFACSTCASTLNPSGGYKIVCLMQSVQWHPFSVRFAMFKSIVSAKHNFLYTYGTQTSSIKLIQFWFTEFKEIGTMSKQQSPVRPQISGKDSLTHKGACQDFKEI
jgi:hypothetical protein